MICQQVPLDLYSKLIQNPLLLTTSTAIIWSKLTSFSASNNHLTGLPASYLPHYGLYHTVARMVFLKAVRSCLVKIFHCLLILPRGRDRMSHHGSHKPSPSTTFSSAHSVLAILMSSALPQTSQAYPSHLEVSLLVPSAWNVLTTYCYIVYSLRSCLLLREAFPNHSLLKTISKSCLSGPPPCHHSVFSECKLHEDRYPPQPEQCLAYSRY